MSSSLTLLLSTLIPGIIWVLIIWLTIPHSTTSFKSFFRFFLYGVISAALIPYFYRVFPGYSFEMTELDSDILTDAFLRIAPLEEILKCLCFVMACSTIPRNSHPTIYLGYGGVLGLGFAVLENLEYGIRYGHDVAAIRSCTSSVLHVGCGIAFSWFFSLGLCIKKWSRNRLDLIFRKFSILKIITYCLIGLLFCIFTHGYYDYVLMSDQPQGNAFFVLFILIASTWAMARSLQVSK